LQKIIVSVNTTSRTVSFFLHFLLQENNIYDSATIGSILEGIADFHFSCKRKEKRSD
jgi:hypothetical protein